MLFPKYQELIQPPGWNSIASQADNTVTGAVTVRVPITREKHVESIYLRVFLTPNAVTTFTPLGQGLAGVVKRVTFTANNRQYINNVSGVSLVRLAANIDAVDTDTENTVNQVAASAANTSFQLTYPIFFGHPQITEPVRDALIIPMPLFNEDGVLEITFDAWANFVTVGTTGAAGTGLATLSAELVINRWHAPTSLPHVVHELNEYDLTLSASGRAAYELPALGSYTGLLVTTLSNATPAAASDLVGAAGYLTLELASTTIRKTRLTNLIRENLMSKVSLRALNSATVRGFSNQSAGYFDFLTDGFGDVPSLNSVVDANPSATGGARFRLNADLTAAGILRIVSHRLYGDLTSLKLTGK